MAKKVHSASGRVRSGGLGENSEDRKRLAEREFQAGAIKFTAGQRSAENERQRKHDAAMRASSSQTQKDIAATGAKGRERIAMIARGQKPGSLDAGGAATPARQNFKKPTLSPAARRKRLGEQALQFETATAQRGGINPKRSTGAKLMPVSSFAFNASIPDVERVSQQHGITDLPVDSRFDDANQRALRIKIIALSRAAQNQQVGASFQRDADRAAGQVQAGQVAARSPRDVLLAGQDGNLGQIDALNRQIGSLGGQIAPGFGPAANQVLAGQQAQSQADAATARGFTAGQQPSFGLGAVDDRITAAWENLPGPLGSQDITQIADIARRPLGMAVAQPQPQQSLNQPAPVPGSPTFQPQAPQTVAPQPVPSPQPERARLITDPQTGQMVAQAPPMDFGPATPQDVSNIQPAAPGQSPQDVPGGAVTVPAPAAQPPITPAIPQPQQQRVDTSVVQPRSAAEVADEIRRRFPTTTANAATVIPQAETQGGGGNLPMTHAERIAETVAKGKLAATKVVLEGERLIQGKAKREEAAATPPPAVASVNQTIANVISSIDAPGTFDTITNLANLIQGAGAIKVGTPDVTKAEQAAAEIERQLAGLSAEDKATAVAAFRESGKLKLIQDARTGLSPNFINKITGTAEAITRTAIAVDRILAAMTGS